MRNDQDMVIRMVAYDLHFAIQHTTSGEQNLDGLVMRFPRSAVIYPEKNNRIPDVLRCRIIFQDGSEHIYQIPTVRIQSYSLEEIQEKHLNLFLPYVLLRLRPRLNPKRKFPLTKNELTAFVDKVMIILKDEVEQGYLTEQEYDDYVNLFRRASEKIFEKHADFYEEVDRMTKPLIELPSVLQKRLIADNERLLANNEMLTADNEMLSVELADKNAELARMRALLEQYHIPVNA